MHLLTARELYTMYVAASHRSDYRIMICKSRQLGKQGGKCKNIEFDETRWLIKRTIASITDKRLIERNQCYRDTFIARLWNVLAGRLITQGESKNNLEDLKWKQTWA